MTNKELLELAAKACGEDGRRYVENKAIQGAIHTGLWCSLLENVWNPLENDCDALRLAVCLGFHVKPKTTRREIVCAAAEIGRLRVKK